MIMSKKSARFWTRNSQTPWPRPTYSLSDGFPLSTLLNVAIEHRLMHAETLAYMLHQLPLESESAANRISRRSTPPIVLTAASTFPRGRLRSAFRAARRSFGWDNEYEAHRVNVPAFAIDQYKVTNQQYLEFIDAGGYETREFWGDDDNRADWTWISASGNFASGFLETRRRSVALSHHVRRSSAAAGLAGLRKSGGSESVCALGREVAAHGSRVAARGIRHLRHGDERAYPWGRRTTPDASIRQL